MVRIALEDFGDGGGPGLDALGGDADAAADEHVGQGRGVVGELRAPASIGELRGIEVRARLGVVGARMQAEQSALAGQMGATLVRYDRYRNHEPGIYQPGPAPSRDQRTPREAQPA